MQKIIIVGVIGVLIVGAGFFIFNNYLYTEKQDDTADIAEVEEPYQATLTGEYVCLTPANGETEDGDCTYGLRTDEGEHYSIIFNVASEENVTLALGDRFIAEGLVTPLSHIRTDQWAYPLKGIFSITGSVKVKTDTEENENSI